MSFPLLPALAACIGAVWVTKVFKERGRPPLPPGPRGLPFIGNALQLPVDHEWFTFAKWGKLYGGVVHVSALGQPLIILNSVQAISDLLEKRSGIYSDRPVLPMAGEMVGYRDSPPLSPYGARHRELRKLMHEGLASSKMEAVFPIEEQKIRDFLRSLLTSPEDLPRHIRRTVAAVVFQISHGYTVKGDDDPLVNLAEKATLEFSLASAPGAFLVDIIPALRYIPDWFPGAAFKKTAAEWRATTMRLKDEPYEQVKKQVASGVALPSFTASLVEKNASPTPEEEDIYKWASTGFYSGGADTSVSAISSFFLAMVLYPDVQRKARDEIIQVVGRGRLPDFKDRDKLPYIEALLKEVLRWNPVAPLALPHRLIQDDIYEGYYLPKGSIVFANTWGVFRDPKLYPSPEEFKPERYFGSGSNSAESPDPQRYAFGYGRRVCPGMHLADVSLYITIVSTLAAFEITNAVDKKTGLPIVPVPNYKAGVICHPEEFECLVKPLYSEAETLTLLGRGS